MTTPATDDTALLLTVPEAAEKLRVHPSTLRKLITDGKLDCVRIGRKVLVTPEEVAAVAARADAFDGREVVPEIDEGFSAASSVALVGVVTV